MATAAGARRNDEVTSHISTYIQIREGSSVRLTVFFRRSEEPREALLGEAGELAVGAPKFKRTRPRIRGRKLPKKVGGLLGGVAETFDDEGHQILRRIAPRRVHTHTHTHTHTQTLASP